MGWHASLEEIRLRWCEQKGELKSHLFGSSWRALNIWKAMSVAHCHNDTSVLVLQPSSAQKHVKIGDGLPTAHSLFWQIGVQVCNIGESPSTHIRCVSWEMNWKAAWDWKWGDIIRLSLLHKGFLRMRTCKVLSEHTFFFNWSGDSPHLLFMSDDCLISCADNFFIIWKERLHLREDRSGIYVFVLSEHLLMESIYSWSSWGISFASDTSFIFWARKLIVAETADRALRTYSDWQRN